MGWSVKKTLGRSRIFYAVQVALSVLISYLLGQKLSESFSEIDPIIGALWTVISTIFVLEEGHLETYKASFMRILGSLIGAATSALFLFLMGRTLGALVTCIFFTIVLCSVLKLYSYLKVANISVAVIMIVAELQNPENIWLFSFLRFLDAAIGIGVAIVMIHLFPLKFFSKAKK